MAAVVYLDPEFDAAEGAAAILAGIEERGDGGDARRPRRRWPSLELTAREAEQRLRRAQRGAERDELLAALEELDAWYRDLVVAAVGADDAVVHFDRLAELRSDASQERMPAAELACELVRQAWREAEELQLSMPLAVEALLLRLRRAGW